MGTSESSLAINQPHGNPNAWEENHHAGPHDFGILSHGRFPDLSEDKCEEYEPEDRVNSEHEMELIVR